MADEKIIKIVAKIDSSSGPSPEQQDKAASEAAMRARMAQLSAEEAHRKSLLGSYSVDTEGGEGSYEGKKRRGPGRPRKPRDPNTPPPPPKGRPGPPPLPEDDPTSPEGQSKLAKAWKIFQKGITAVNGANGHLTKSVAFVTRSFEFSKETMDDFKEAGITAAGAMQGIKSAGGAAATAMGATASASASIAAAAGTAAVTLGVAGLAVAAFTIKLGVTTAALNMLISVTNNLQEVVGKFSASLEAARAVNEVNRIQERIRSAGRVGGELASLEASKGSGERALIETKTEIVDLISPLVKAGLDFFTITLKNLNLILFALNKLSDGIEIIVETILKIFTYVPVLGLVAKKALSWMQQDEINNLDTSHKLNEHFEQLFQAENLGFPDKPKKNTVAGKFLP